jgi:chromosome segregation ATPase
MTGGIPPQADRPRPRPAHAINARRQASADKLASVTRVVQLLGRTGVPITVSAVHRLAGVSRSFTYENEEARALIVAAQLRSLARANGRIDALTAQQEASWRERALNAEDHVRDLRREVTSQRRLISELTGQLREPDGTWIARDRERLREANELLLIERNNLLRERSELHRRLGGARANVSRLNAQRVAELYPDGPGKPTA